MLLIGKPSISMGHLYHGYVSHDQMVPTSNISKMGYQKWAGHGGMGSSVSSQPPNSLPGNLYSSTISFSSCRLSAKKWAKFRLEGHVAEWFPHHVIYHVHTSCVCCFILASNYHSLSENAFFAGERPFALAARNNLKEVSWWPCGYHHF